MIEKTVIPKNWKMMMLSNIAEINMGQSPKGDTYNIAGNGMPFYQGVTEFGDKYVKTKMFTTSPIKIVITNTILLSVRAPVGKINITKHRACIGRGNAGLIMRNGNQDFLYYLLRYLERDIIGHSTGTVFDAINRKDIESISIIIPSKIEEQRAIAKVLSTLDEKIELLQEQNKTLEAIAQAMFKEWFVVKAKDKWEEKSLDEIANYLNGLACQKYPPTNEIDKLPVLKIKDLKNGFTDNSDWASSTVNNKYIVELGDVIFSWSGSLMLKIWDNHKCVLNQHLFKITSDVYPKWLYYFWTKHHLDKFIGIANSKATTMGHIKRSDISNSLVKVPRTKELSAMHEIISPKFNKMILNYKNISSLENLREFLMPKLMSGAVKAM